MTEKLYYQNSYLNRATATIKKIEENRIFLDSTIFFPEGGGQVGDTGMIAGYRVIDTQKTGGRSLINPSFPMIQVDTDVIHILEAFPKNLNEGQTVELAIDWERRYRIMQLHSASHLVYHFALEFFGEMNVKGFFVDEHGARFDFHTAKKLNGLERIMVLCNSMVEKALPIEMRPLEGETEALFWVCDGIAIPCGGTHLRNTEEVQGKISLRRKNQGKKLERLYITINLTLVN